MENGWVKGGGESCAVMRGVVVVGVMCVWWWGGMLQSVCGMVVWRRGEQSIWLYSWRRVQEGVEWWRVLWEEGREGLVGVWMG